MRLPLFALAALCSVTLSAYADPIAITATPNTATPPAGGMKSSYSGVTTITFNGTTTLPTGFTGGAVVKGGTVGAYAPPDGDTTNYYAVGSGPSYTGSATFSPGSSLNYFGFYWGSIDAYNSVSFYNNSTLIGTVSGGMIPPANGNQTAANTNEFVDFFLTGGNTYNSVVFNTTSANFELDNVAYGNVTPTAAITPEPSSLALLGTGLLGLVGVARRRLA